MLGGCYDHGMTTTPLVAPIAAACPEKAEVAAAKRKREAREKVVATVSARFG